MAEAKSKKAPKVKKVKAPAEKVVRMVKLKKQAIPEEGISPQAKVILETLKEGGGNMDRQDLVSKLEKGNKLKTEQPVTRIVSFYTPKLVEAGLIEVNKVNQKVAA